MPITERDRVPPSDALQRLAAAMAATTTQRARALAIMARRTPNSLGADRRSWWRLTRLASLGRRDALRAGIILPPWWQLRLATANAPPAPE